MNMKELLLQNWDYAMGQEDWYPPILPALKDVTVEQALWKPEGQAANSIWENVQHLLYYKQRLLARLEGTPLPNEGIGNDETFLIHDTSEGHGIRPGSSFRMFMPLYDRRWKR